VEDWKLYRTRFLAKARRLDQPCSVTDACGRTQQGGPGDYLVEGSDGSRRIAPAHVFEDIYVELGSGTRQPACSRAARVQNKVYNMLWLHLDKHH